MNLESHQPSFSAAELEVQGDEHLAAARYDAAKFAYLAALEQDPQNASLYEKLLSVKQKESEDWTQEDFVESLSWVMEKQEIEHPAVKLAYERLSADYVRVRHQVMDLLEAQGSERDLKTVDLRALGEKAVLPLLDVLLDLDTAFKSVLAEAGKTGELEEEK